MPAPRLAAALLRQPVHFFALGFGAGLFRKAPGTAGTLIAVVPAWLIAGWSWQAKAALIVALFVFGVWICGESARRIGVHDHGGIVWDEICGMYITLLLTPPTVLGYDLAFCLFRFFDIVKPWPIRDLDHRLGGGLGIMLDDLVAALYALILLVLYGWLMT